MENKNLSCVDPDMRRVLERYTARWMSRPTVNLNAPQKRDLMYLDLSYWNDLDRLAGITKSEHWAVNGAQAFRLARYRRQDGKPQSVLYWLHGGGWISGSIETHEGIFHRLLRHADIEIIAANYALAPESPYPAAIDDAELGLEEILSTGDIRASQVTIGGDSAGAQIAASVAVRRAQSGADLLRGQVLVYGAFYPAWEGPSHYLYGSGSYGLSSAAMQQSWRDYLPEDKSVHYVPDLKAASSYPKTWLISAQCDCLAQDSIKFAEDLLKQGVDITHTVCNGLIHGFLHMGAASSAADRMVNSIAQYVLCNRKQKRTLEI